MKTIRELWEPIAKIELVQVRPEEMEPMYNHCFEFENPLIVEIGSAHGASTLIFAQAAAELDGMVYAIDHFPEEYYAQEKFGSYGKRQFLRNIKPYNAVVRHIDIASEKAIPELSSHINASLDVLFIDGMHSYEAVQKDCQLYLPLLRSGGYVGFHDYNNVAFQVKQAADEFCSGWEKESVWDLAIFKKP